MELGQDTHLWWVRLDRSEPDDFSLPSLLSPDERQRAARFYFDRDRRHFVAARGLLRLFLGRYAGCPPERIAFCYGPQGKPALSGRTDLQFNIAHSDGVGLFGFTQHAPIGVDAERVRAIEHDELATRFFSAAERAALERMPPGARLGAFYTCWARKEAYLKARGGGLSVPLDRFDVAVSPDERARLLADRGEPDAAAIWALHDVDGGARFRGAVAVRNSETPIRVFGTPDVEAAPDFRLSS